MKRWTAAELKESAWFEDLMARIREEMVRRSDRTPDRRPALTAEAARLEQQMQGWSQSLANPNLTRAVRNRIESDFTSAQEHCDSISAELATLNAVTAHSVVTVTAEDVVDRLNRLSDILQANDPTRTNLELSLHIDRITVFDDSRVIVRTCQLGALAGVMDGLADVNAEKTQLVPSIDNLHRATPRRRARLRVSGEDSEGNDLDDAAHFVADVHRFARLGREWFWEDEFTIPEPTCWAKENAAAVAAKRAEGLTHTKLAEFFGVCVPTVRKALKIAESTDPSVARMPRKIPRARWPEQHFREVDELRKQGKSVEELTKHFGKCQPLISRALRLAATSEKATPKTGTATESASSPANIGDNGVA